MPSTRTRLKYAYLHRVFEPALGKINQRWGSPTIDDLLRRAPGPLSTTPGEFVAALLGAPVPDEVHAEYAELTREVASRPRNTDLYVDHDVEEGTAFVVYATTRLTRPQHVVETGVANGVSTFFFLHALAANGGGTLHSFDVRPRVAPVLTDAERAGWDLRVLRGDHLRADFVREMAELPDLDAFLHDSDHHNRWMRLEYEAALRKLRPGGLLLSDDVETTHAFAEVCAERALHPTYLFDRRKLVGAVRV